MTSRPWMPLWIDDYLSDTTALNAAEHGAYLLLIMHYWQHGSLPKDEKILRRIARMTPRQWTSSVSLLREHFTEHWTHNRVDRELKQVIEKSKVNSANARKSHINRRANAHANANTLHTSNYIKKDLEPTNAIALASLANGELRALANGKVFVKDGTKEWDAWCKFLGKRPPTNRDFGWFFESSMPPI